MISYNSCLALLFVKCFYNFFWDKRKSHKGEMLVGGGGKGKTVQQEGLEEFMEADGGT